MSKFFVAVNEQGRRVGESHPRATLSDHEVDLLLELLEFREELIARLREHGATQAVVDAKLREEQLSYRELGIKFEVHKQTIAKIANGHRRCLAVVTYKQLPVPLTPKK